MNPLQLHHAPERHGPPPAPAWITRLVRAALGALLASAAVCAAQPEPTLDESDRRCLQCHGQAHIAELGPAERRSMVGTWLDTETPAPETLLAPEPLTGNEPAARPALLVPRRRLASSPHADTRCVDCHEDAARLPHAADLSSANCASTCHTDAWEAYTGGSHNDALLHEDQRAPTCASCHGGHDIHRIDDRDAPQHRLNSLFLCGDCHAKHGTDPEGLKSASNVASYLDSAHAKGVTEAGLLFAATCADCHDAHGVHPAADPRSSVHRANVPGTCGKCHEGVEEVYKTSIHGRLLDESDERAPVCTDCHTAHSITRASSPDFLLEIINECGECHDTPPENGDRVGTYYDSYTKSYHGQVTKLGSPLAARCSDCHGAHDILPLDHADSRVGPAKIVATCAECHPGANANFAKFDPHANYRDRRNYPILHGIWWYFIIVMSSVFTFFGLHTVLWFARSIVDRIRHGPPHKHGHATTAIRRFTTLNRVNHVLVAVTFFGLTATGIPLVFSQQAWAAVLAGLFGGVEAAGIWHRFFATLLLTNFVLHFIGLGRSFLRRDCSWRQWLFGPNSLLPRWKDVTDCLGMFLWFFGRHRRPSFDRWTYWEKFDYWAEIFGSIIIGGTGLLLWFPVLASKIFPGWTFNIAMIIHGYEALLAICFIFTIHFFNTHVRPGAFPVDEVIFTGSMPEEELKEHRPTEYERLVRSGKLDSFRVPAPDRARRPLFVLVGVVAVSIGTTLFLLIVLGGLNLI